MYFCGKYNNGSLRFALAVEAGIAGQSSEGPRGQDSGHRHHDLALQGCLLVRHGARPGLEHCAVLELSNQDAEAAAVVRDHASLCV